MKTKKLSAILTCTSLISGMISSVPVSAAETKNPVKNDGAVSDDSIEKLVREFELPEQKYAPYEFWFYDQNPDTLGIKGQDMSHEVVEKGFNPGYAHARTDSVGKSTSNSREKWLTDSWFDLFEKQVKQANADNAHLGFCDEFGWPSFQAGGKVLAKYPELRSKSLVYSVYDVPAGDSVYVPAGDFAVAGKLISTENSSYVTFVPEYAATKAGGNSSTGWCNVRPHRDESTAWQDTKNPYNGSCVYTDAGNGDRYAEYHAYVRKGGSYDVYAFWHNVGGSASNAIYDINGTKVTVNQKENVNKWNLLGEFDFDSENENIIKVDNKANGRIVIDAVKLVKKDDPNEIIVIDDKNDTDRKIGYLDSDSLSLIGGGAPFMWTAPDNGAYRVYDFKVQATSGYDGSTVNYLDSELADKFIDIAYKPYEDRFKEYMGSGKTINGVFSDHEGDYGYKMAYSEDLEQLFKEKTGEDMRVNLPLLIDRDIQGKDVTVRFNWFDSVSDLYSGNIGKVVDYANSLGMYYTMHTWEAVEGLQFQAGVVGDYFKLTRKLTLPGTDALERGVYNPATFKEAQSIADIEGRRLMNEHSALLSAYDYTPAEMKTQANYLAANGVSNVVSHSLKMTREKAQESVTPDFYNIDPNWNYMNGWTNYLRRTSYINSNGHLNAKVLLMSPMDSIWSMAEDDFFNQNYELHVNMGRYGGAFSGEAGEMNLLYNAAIRQLTRNRIEHLAVDKYYLNQMTQENGNLVLGDRSFKTVIMPPMKVIDKNVARKLLEFAKNGGYVYYLGTLPTGSLQEGRDDAQVRSMMSELAELPTVYYTSDLGEALKTNCPGLESQVQFIDGKFDLLSHYRVIDGKHVIFVTNNTSSSHESKLYIPNIKGSVKLMDPQLGTISPAHAAINRNGVQVELTFAPYQSFYLLIDPDENLSSSTVDVADTESSITTGWKAAIDKGNTSEILEHTFDAVMTDKIRIVIKKGSFDDLKTAKVSEVTINGGTVEYTPSASSNAADIDLIKDSSRNTAWQNSEAIELDEPQWIVCDLGGKTTVSSVEIASGTGAPLISYRIEVWDGTWWKTADELNTNTQPELISAFTYPDALINGVDVTLSNWNTWSFMPSNFAGCVDYTNTIKLVAGKKTIVDLETVDGGAELWINGKSAGYRLTPPFRYDISDLVTEGDNSVCVRVANTIGSNIKNFKGGLTAFNVLTVSEQSYVADTEKAPEEKPAYVSQPGLGISEIFDPSTFPLVLTEPEIETVNIGDVKYDLYEAEEADFGPCTVGNAGVIQPNISTNSGNAYGGKTLGWWSAESYVNFAVNSSVARDAEILISYAVPGQEAKFILELDGVKYTTTGEKTSSHQDHHTVSAGIIPLKKGYNIVRLTQNGTTANIDAILVRSYGQSEPVSTPAPSATPSDPEALNRYTIPYGWTSVVSDDMSAYTPGDYTTANEILGNWTIKSADNKNGVQVVNIATDPGSGNGKAIKIDRANFDNSGEDCAVFTLDSPMEAPFIVKFDFYDPNPTEGNGAIYRLDYSNGDYDFLTMCQSNIVKDVYGIRKNGSYIASETKRNIGWHEFVASADSGGKITYYIDGSKLSVAGRELLAGQTFTDIMVRSAGWSKDFSQTGYITNVKIYQPGEASTISVPADSILAVSDDLSSYAEGSVTGQSHWSVASGKNAGEIVELSAGGHAVKINKADDSAVYSLDNNLSAPFLVTMKFYDPNPTKGNGAIYQIDYSDGQYDFLTLCGGAAFMDTYGIRQGSDYKGTSFKRSEGWHEFAALADSNGEVTYYIDGTKLDSVPARKLARGQAVKGINIRGAGWNWTDQTGYMKDLNFYKLKPEFTATMSDDTVTLDLLDNGYYTDSYVAIVAMFNGERLLDCQYKTKEELQESDFSINVKDATKLVCYLWGDFSFIRPISNMQTITIPIG